MYIVKSGFLCGLLALVLALLYLPVYIRTRRIKEFKTDRKENLTVNLFLCCVFNCLISGVIIKESPALPDFIFAFALMIIADFDLLIFRIPTEFLMLLYVSILPGIITQGNWAYVLTSLVLWSLWWIAQKEGLIAIYDVWLLLPLALYLNDTKKALLFYALFLVLWGCFALILRYLCKKDPHTKIPLAPLMALSFVIMRLSP